MHKLWTNGDENFFRGAIDDVRASSSLSSLVCGVPPRQNARRSINRNAAIFKLVTNVVHRFEQSIAGRPYLIEVANVSQDRWRAYIVRIPGVPTALMPFYGRTPVEAAGLLTEWLSRAYQRAASTATG